MRLLRRQAQAAALDGNEVKSYDQTGAAQKWGPVLSSLIVAKSGEPIISNKIRIARADLYLALDAMAGADRHNLSRRRERSSEQRRLMLNASSGRWPSPVVRLPDKSLNHLHELAVATIHIQKQHRSGERIWPLSFMRYPHHR